MTGHKLNRSIGVWAAFAAALSLLLGACTFRRPGLQTVAPTGVNDNRMKIAKTFLSGTDSSGRKKRFIFGMAPERELGWVSSLLNIHGVPEFEHSNIEFDITEDYLIGLAVNPTYPNDRSQWKPLIRIPIVSHYYYERAKDQNGRETNVMIENSERSHFSARPFIKLDLTRVEIIEDMTSSYKWARANSVTDIEVDQANGFIGFSVRTEGIFRGVNQTTYRVNLKSFERNPKFKKTPFHEQNYKYLNVLHVMGKKTETQDQVLLAAHWDLNKQHKVILTGFPKEYQQLGIDTVETWNKTFQEIGAVPPGHRPFIPEVRELKHPFDLRYTSMHWVSDIRISMQSPLGVGVTTADVESGEIVWGKVTAYGGFLEAYIKANQQLASSSAAAHTKVKFSDSFFDLSGWNSVLSLPNQMQEILKGLHGQSQQLDSEAFLKLQAQKIKQASRQQELERAANQREFPTNPATALISLAPEQVRTLFVSMHSTIRDLRWSQSRGAQIGQLMRAYGLDRYMTRVSDSLEKSDQASDPLSALRDLPAAEQYKRLAAKFTRNDCADRSFADMAGGWSAALRQSRSGDIQFFLNNMIYELLLHEMGHMIGLGHQFKENILPGRHAVPQHIFDRLATEATPERGFTNYTSVMGYRAPRTELFHYDLAYREGKKDHKKIIMPGEQDKLVLRYLYRQEFPVYEKGQKDFSYYAIPKNGILPARVRQARTAYFPQCNDGEASFGLDPYCNRFDRGSDPMTLVQSYFDYLKDNMIQRLIAFSDTRLSDRFEAEAGLMMGSLRSFSRVRVFYDYMRARMETDLPMETQRILQSEDALYEFSRACSSERGSDNPMVGSLLNEMFNKNPHIKALCQANAYALKEFANILSLSVADDARVDFDGYFFPAGLTGGEVDFDYSKVFGTWKELGAFPMKLAALFAMQSASPFVTLGSYVFPIPNYDTPERRYAYNSLYPREFTEAQTAVVKNNLKFANVHFGESTHIGKSVLYLGILPHVVGGSNDPSRLPPQYVQRLRSQADFNLSFVAVLLKKSENQQDKYIAKKFNPTIYDLNTGKEANATEAYLLPEGDVIVRSENSFLVPVSKFQFLDDDTGYVFAYRLSFYENDDDVLSSVSAKTALRDLHEQTLMACMKGTDNNNLNGLASYFNPTNDDFKGFIVAPQISRDDQKQKAFKESIRKTFIDYYSNQTAAGKPKFKTAPSPSTCQHAIQGLKMVVSAAALLNGYWMPTTGDYIRN